MIEPRQIRAARALLDWTRDDLARASGVSANALSQIEGEGRAARSASLDKIKSALEAAGVTFTDNAGVKMRSDLVQIFEGIDGFKHFSDDRYIVAQNDKREFLMCGGFQDDFISATGADYFKFHASRMSTIEGFAMRALIKPSVDIMTVQSTGYIQSRILPDNYFTEVPFYIYGSKLAIILIDTGIRIIVINDEHMAGAYRKQFDLLWKISKRVEA